MQYLLDVLEPAGSTVLLSSHIVTDVSSDSPKVGIRPSVRDRPRASVNLAVHPALRGRQQFCRDPHNEASN